MPASSDAAWSAGDTVKATKVHVVGLAGAGVSGLVPLLQARGATVTGSDLYESPMLDALRGRGVVCNVGHTGSNLDPATDLVLISAAIGMDNPEVRAAADRSIQILKYAQCLGYLMGEKHGIAVAGTHGKTTTTAMVAYVLVRAGLDPSFVIGGEYPGLGGGSRSGRGPHFVAEACEYDRSFLNLRPHAAIVTNIEEDHLDYFNSIGEIQTAFSDFVRLLPAQGLLVYNHDDPRSRFLREIVRCRAEGFSLENPKAAWRAEDVELDAAGCRFAVRGPRRRPVTMRLRVPGIHNVRNALACTAVCTTAGVPPRMTAEALAEFTGVRRRFDVLLRDPVVVIDDYAHHPTEVETVIRSARQMYPGRRLICVFQPHQYSRLRHLLAGFAEVIAKADESLVTQVYRCRDSDEDVAAINSPALVRLTKSLGGSCWSTPTFDDATDCLERLDVRGAVVAFLGAGTVSTLARSLAKRWSDPAALTRDRGFETRSVG